MDEFLILLLAPTRRDGAVTRGLLERAGLQCRLCSNAPELAQELQASVGAILMTDTALLDPNFDQVVAALAAQPAWSDIPTVILSRGGRQSPAAARALDALANVSLLERPTSSWTLISAIRAAIRGRRRQYEIRDQLQALETAQQELRLADRRKDEFLAMLAHELRNPLAPIRHASELLARTLPEHSQTQAVVDVVRRQVTHLTRLVDDLLDVSRITQGRIELRREPLELGSVVAQALESIEPLFREKHHHVIATASPRRLHIDGDRERLVQCVANVLTNAAKYTDSGGDIQIETRAEGATALIVVSDNGVGIPADLMPRIFDLFVQSARSLARSEGGLGIGLSVVQRLIEMHGGAVTAYSAGPGQGSRFELRVPLCAAAAASTTTAPELEPHATAAKRILIVDDNVDAADSLRLVLELDGHTAVAVHSGDDALAQAPLFAPEVIILDIGLPVMDGYEVARRVRNLPNLSEVRLVALTGYGRAEDRQRSLNAGFDAHLVKPVDYRLLERTLTEDSSAALSTD